jgi:DNA-binding CsgD family transcriptional regulator
MPNASCAYSSQTRDPLSTHSHRSQNFFTDLRELFAHALDWLSCGVVIVDEDVKPLFANRAAALLIDTGRLPFARRATLYRADPIREIRQALASCERANDTVTCRVGEPPLTCTVVNLARSASNRPARAIIFLSDSEQRRTIRLRDVAGLGLTPAEAAVAVEFANGHSLQTCAKRLAISFTTAKTHLRHIFEKTGAARQAELMRFILTSAPPYLMAANDRTNTLHTRSG